jgi:hypothetical protein
MSVGSMLSNLFGGGTPVANPAGTAPAIPQQGNLPAAPTPGMASAPGNPNTPAASPADPNPAAPLEGLDKFTDIWKPVESPAGAAPDAMFNVKPEQLMEAAKKLDFTKVIQPQQLQAIAQGGDGAVQAFAQALNTVAQTVYAQNAHATTKIVEQAVNQAKESMRTELPQHIKLQSVSDQLGTSNPALAHPAAAPIIGALKQQLTMKFPQASASEIASMANDYMTSFAQTMQPKTQAAAQPAEMNWDQWAGS